MFSHIFKEKPSGDLKLEFKFSRLKGNQENGSVASGAIFSRDEEPKEIHELQETGMRAK